MASQDDELAARVAALLDQALSRLKHYDTGARVFPLDEAAGRLNMSARTLEQWCRAGQIDHTKIGKFRGLTAQQIDRVVADHAVSKGTPAATADDELAVARETSLKAAARRTSGRAA